MDKLIDEKIAKTFIVAGVVLEKDGKYLLVQEKKASCYGKWNLPAGKVEVGDSIEETAVKEAKEESGYDVELIGKLGVYHESVEKPVKHIFEAKITGGELNFPEDEILDAKWFLLEEILDMKENTRVSCVWESIEKLEQNKK